LPDHVDQSDACLQTLAKLSQEKLTREQKMLVKR